MKLKKDRDILQLVFKYGNMLLILPNFHFIEKEIGISPLRLINSVVLMLLIVCGYLISISGRIVHVYNHGDTGPIDSFLDFSTYFLLTVTNITIVLDSLMKRGAWKELLKFLLAADVFVSRKEYLLYTTLFVLLHIYYFLLFFFDSYVWLNAAEAPFYKYYFFRIVQEYMCLLMVFSMGIINSMLKARFKTLNNVLMDSRKIKNKVIHTLQKPIKVIDNATQQYIKLYNAVMLFNRIFSWQNFLIVTYAIFSILDNVEKALVHSSLKVNASSISYGKFFISLCVGSIAMTKVVAIIISCDLTTKEASRIVTICYTQQQFYPATFSVRYELIKLALLARDLKPEFTAAGFFVINRITFFTVLSVATTYFIVILQFTN